MFLLLPAIVGLGIALLEKIDDIHDRYCQLEYEKKYGKKY